MATQFTPIGDWQSWENQGAGLAVADIKGNGNRDLMVLRVDAPQGANQAFYRIGWDLNAAGAVTAGYSEWLPIPDWTFWENQGADIAVADLDGNGRPDLIVFQIDGPPGQNQGYYRIGWNLDVTGHVTGGWGPWVPVPDWFSWENVDAGIAVADVNGTGQHDLIVFHIDSPDGANLGYYRIGWSLDVAGNAATWSPWRPVVGWFSWENQGGGIALADLDGDGRLELVVFQIDAPAGENKAYYTIGWNLGPDGKVSGWSPWVPIPDWDSWENQGGAVALAPLSGGAQPELVVLRVDNPPDGNTGSYAVVPLTLDTVRAPQDGIWRLLPDFTDVLPIHGALLHTGKVLFFAGSSNNPARAGVDFRSRVWDYAAGTFTAPATPIDFFCAGHSFLADGRLLVAGGTKEYDTGHPFFGLVDTFVFHPASEQWRRMANMAGGRWYPTLVTLGNGNVLAMSGLGEHGEDPFQDLEVYSEPVGWKKLPAALSQRWPLYAHLFLLKDGRVFYTGGQFGVAYDHMHPRLVNLTTAAIVDVHGLSSMDQRNQSASILLPPAQAQRAIVIGGGSYGADVHHHHATTDATDHVDQVDLNATPPAYAATGPLHTPRMHVLAVILPDRTVLVCGGSQMEESRAAAVLGAEIYHPATGLWSVGAKAQIPRLYHSVAILLPDGRVVCAGSNPVRQDEELRLEVYYPSYLFKTQRPRIGGAPSTAAYGSTISIGTPQAASIKWVSLVHPVAMTHSSDSSQRLVDVPFAPGPVVNTLSATIPANANLLPPGWYMLFLTDASDIPSEATWIHVT
ncbi:MAG: galactose oxidase-like domain-containing protein [Deltaproteobacteria bacterium]